MNFFSWMVLRKRFGALRYFMKDKNVKWYKKALIIFCIAYLFMPIDLIPIAVPILGLVDDVALWLAVIYYLKDELDKYWVGETSVDYSREFKDSVNVENYTVDEGEDKTDD